MIGFLDKIPTGLVPFVNKTKKDANVLLNPNNHNRLSLSTHKYFTDLNVSEFVPIKN